MSSVDSARGGRLGGGGVGCAASSDDDLSGTSSSDADVSAGNSVSNNLSLMRWTPASIMGLKVFWMVKPLPDLELMDCDVNRSCSFLHMIT
jgi:hypothetical protein